jgi:hypothetical protein
MSERDEIREPGDIVIVLSDGAPGWIATKVA